LLIGPLIRICGSVIHLSRGIRETCCRHKRPSECVVLGSRSKRAFAPGACRRITASATRTVRTEGNAAVFDNGCARAHRVLPGRTTAWHQSLGGGEAKLSGVGGRGGASRQERGIRCQSAGDELDKQSHTFRLAHLAVRENPDRGDGIKARARHPYEQGIGISDKTGQLCHPTPLRTATICVSASVVLKVVSDIGTPISPR